MSFNELKESHINNRQCYLFQSDLLLEKTVETYGVTNSDYNNHSSILVDDESIRSFPRMLTNIDRILGIEKPTNIGNQNIYNGLDLNQLTASAASPTSFNQSFPKQQDFEQHGFIDTLNIKEQPLSSQCQTEETSNDIQQFKLVIKEILNLMDSNGITAPHLASRKYRNDIDYLLSSADLINSSVALVAERLKSYEKLTIKARQQNKELENELCDIKETKVSKLNSIANEAIKLEMIISEQQKVIDAQNITIGLVESENAKLTKQLNTLTKRVHLESKRATNAINNAKKTEVIHQCLLKQNESLQEKLRDLTKKLKEVEIETKNLQDINNSGEISTARLEEENKRLRKQVKSAEEEIESLVRADTNHVETIRDMETNAKRIETDRNQIQKELISVTSDLRQTRKQIQEQDTTHQEEISRLKSHLQSKTTAIKMLQSNLKMLTIERDNQLKLEQQKKDKDEILRQKKNRIIMLKEQLFAASNRYRNVQSKSVAVQTLPPIKRKPVRSSESMDSMESNQIGSIALDILKQIY